MAEGSAELKQLDMDIAAMQEAMKKKKLMMPQDDVIVENQKALHALDSLISVFA